MTYHPQPNGGDKPLGKEASESKTFVESLFTRFSAQKEELIAMMNQCDEGFCKELLQKLIKGHGDYINEILEYLEMVDVKPVTTKETI